MVCVIVVNCMLYGMCYRVTDALVNCMLYGMCYRVTDTSSELYVVWYVL